MLAKPGLVSLLPASVEVMIAVSILLVAVGVRLRGGQFSLATHFFLFSSPESGRGLVRSVRTLTPVNGWSGVH
ncbi:hypothetical protein ACQUQP_14705 [Marinobacterium sp. YM272]|uniref:hypothetical protein n=1 Tax=Marinobacterium sp. YM272 TaxID=3421654 RepID=UPI003D7FE542